MHPTPVLAASGRCFRQGHGASQPRLLHLSSSSKTRSPSGTPCSALHRLVLRLVRPLLTPAAPSRRLSTPVAPWQTTRPPRVRRATFVPYTCRIYARTLRVISGFGSFGPLARMQTPHMRFLFVRPALCLQLPSDPASRRRPCCSASGSHHQGPQRTLTSKSPRPPPQRSRQRQSWRHAPCLAHKKEAAQGGFLGEPSNLREGG
jgi:hypothetical protein